MVNHFLRYLQDASGGQTFTPEPLGTDAQGRQRLSFLPGRAPTPPYPPWVFAPELLVAVAEQQAELHRLASSYQPPPDAVWAVSAGNYFPGEAVAGSDLLVCHNDLGMTNVIVNEANALVGVIDFDYLRPVDRLSGFPLAISTWPKAR